LDKDEEITEEVILKKLNEIIAVRGRRATNHQDQLQSLNILRQHIKKHNLDTAIDVKVILIQIIINFDYLHKGKKHFKLETWTQ
jgi:translation initiation factor 3 subunit C